MTQQEQSRGHGRLQWRAARAARAQMVVIIGFVVFMVVGLTAFFLRTGSQSRLAGGDRADVSNPALVTAGRQMYLSRCAGCHGVHGKGAPGWQQRGPDGMLPAPPIDASGPSPRRSDAWLFAVIKQGGQVAAEPGTISGMPGFGANLSDAEIWALISYIKSTWPPQLQLTQPTGI